MMRTAALDDMGDADALSHSPRRTYDVTGRRRLLAGSSVLFAMYRNSLVVPI